MTNPSSVQLVATGSPIANARPRNLCSLAMLGILCTFLFCAATAMTSAQTVTTLLNFNIANGADPFAGMVQGADGDFYGTTQAGGISTACTNGCGMAFKIDATGALTTLYSFGGSDGAGIQAGLVLATNGNFYGTAYTGGANNPPACQVDGFVGCGTVFEITPAGVLTTLHNFDSTDGYFPAAGLVQAANGNLYGTTNFGGTNSQGTVFKITPSGTLTTLYNFDGADGFIPNGTLIQGSDGNFYGTTSEGGNMKACLGGCGTVFKITPTGKLTTLHKFDGSDGNGPLSGLVQGTDGNLYGTTNFGGTGESCQTACGIVFKMTPSGVLTTLYTFTGTPYGPYAAPLVQGTDGNFYGTTQANLVFKITPAGTLTTLFTFDFTDGFEPLAGLLQATNGKFYGTTYQGGEGYGNIFSLATGLSPFVKTEPTSGNVGSRFIILGNNLTGATVVNFNGIAAPFTVVSSTEIKAMIPSGATTGYIYVETPAGTFKSNVKFRVP